MPTTRQGTRLPSGQSSNTIGPATRSLESSYTRDLGLLKNVLGPLVLTSGTATIAPGGALQTYQAGGLVPVTGPGYLAAFQVGDTVQLQGTTMNDGSFTVTAVNGGGTSLTVTPPPKSESAAVVTMRTP